LLRYDSAAESFLKGNALVDEARRLEPEELSQTGPQLLPGQQIGAYKILALLGRGGMGVVYRARDERLRRDVAIKVLPTSYSTDGDRLRRFEQEAHATSALNHPNILTIHDIGAAAPELGGAPFIVAELLEGEDLRAQLNDGPLKLRQALDYAQQIAAGLAAAHERGVVHRDLKPENLFVTTDGRVKILDFGLAKLRPQKLAGGVNSQAPTQRPLTDPGVIMGTVGYMSPEQVRGQETDHRSDIFSFGMILYEMLGGRRAFNGASVADVMSAILKEEPPELSETNAKISPALDKIVRRCLEKKPERRFQTMSDLGFALEALSLSSSSGARLETQAASAAVSEIVGASSVRKREWLAWAIAALLLVTLGLTWAYFARRPTTDALMMKFSILPPEKSSFSQIAVSPDGRYLAFTAATGGKVQLWAQALDSTEARALDGTRGAYSPFWSPDSRSIGFFADGKLKKIGVDGGPVQTLCEAPASPRGFAWNRDEMILFGQVQSGIWRTSATRGEVTQVTTLDRTRQEFAHWYPTFLPDGRHFLYNILSGRKEIRGTYIGSLDGTLKRRRLDNITPIKYLAAVPGDMDSGAGWLVFVRDDALLARPFDARQLEFTGEPFSLSDKVGSGLGPNTFSVSDNGVLVFDPKPNRLNRQYYWMNRRGQLINSLDVAAGPTQHWLSPDEKRFVADRNDPQTFTSDLWLFDVSGGNPQRFTFNPAQDFIPIWSPNGSSIVWASTRDVIMSLYQKAASGAGDETLLLKTEYPIYPTDWSRDGSFIIYYERDPMTKMDVWALPMTASGKGKQFRVIGTEANETAGTLSPDGRWLAYASDESGRYEIYVQNFPKGGGKRQVSTGGGNWPRWRRDGHELFYYSADGNLMAAPVKSGESFEIGAAFSLFEFRAGTAQGMAPYAVTGDGQRFLINTVVETEPNAPLTVWENWTAGVKK
jgi:serine/threonine protein kinase/Tol biopolymer transport system component